MAQKQASIWNYIGRQGTSASTNDSNAVLIDLCSTETDTDTEFEVEPELAVVDEAQKPEQAQADDDDDVVVVHEIQVKEREGKGSPLESLASTVVIGNHKEKEVPSPSSIPDLMTATDTIQGATEIEMDQNEPNNVGVAQQGEPSYIDLILYDIIGDPSKLVSVRGPGEEANSQSGDGGKMEVEAQNDSTPQPSTSASASLNREKRKRKNAVVSSSSSEDESQVVTRKNAKEKKTDRVVNSARADPEDSDSDSSLSRIRHCKRRLCLEAGMRMEESDDDVEAVSTSTRVRKKKTDADSSSESESESDSVNRPSTSKKQPSQRRSLRSSSKSNGKMKTGNHGSDDDDDDLDDAPLASRLRRRKRKSIKSDSSDSSKEATTGDDCTDTEDDPEKVPRASRVRKRRFKKKTSITLNSLESSDSGEEASSTPEKSGIKRKVSKKTLRSATAKKKRLSEKEIALQRLNEQREARKLKDAEKRARKKSPARNSNESEEERSKNSNSSNSSSEESSWDVVPDDVSGQLSNFEGSTPSSSSVTSSGETNEDPDLESGSEGDKDLPQDDDDGRFFQKSDRSSTSSEDEEPDDGANDPRCLLCKNLGSKKNFEGRAAEGNTNWCRCGECQIVDTDARDYDLICCKEVRGVAAFLSEEMEDDVCITRHPRFEMDVLMNHGYARAISKGCNFNLCSGGGVAGFFEYHYASRAGRERLYEQAISKFKYASHRGKFHLSLKSFMYWIFDQLEDGVAPKCRLEIVIPACVMKKLRETFHVEHEPFPCFRARFKCENGRHCGATFNATPPTPPPPYMDEDD